MLEGVFGGNQSFQVNQGKASKGSNVTQSGVDFKNALVDLARSANMTIAGKGDSRELAFNKWRELEDNLYFNFEEEMEDAALDYLKKLKKIIKEKLDP